MVRCGPDERGRVEARMYSRGYQLITTDSVVLGYGDHAVIALTLWFFRDGDQDPDDAVLS